MSEKLRSGRDAMVRTEWDSEATTNSAEVGSLWTVTRHPTPVKRLGPARLQFNNPNTSHEEHQRVQHKEEISSVKENTALI